LIIQEREGGLEQEGEFLYPELSMMKSFYCKLSIHSLLPLVHQSVTVASLRPPLLETTCRHYTKCLHTVSRRSCAC
jgi:hypothetical protein